MAECFSEKERNRKRQRQRQRETETERPRDRDRERERDHDDWMLQNCYSARRTFAHHHGVLNLGSHACVTRIIILLRRPKD